MNTTKEISSTTQKFLDIHDIVNDLVILKDGSTALIITVNAMNFGLLAEEEQDAIIYSYAGLLNSLNYPIQIVIKSQTKDVTSYLHLLDEELETATSQIKRDWIKKYRSFVGNLIKERNVLDKKFYVVVPATALEMGLVAPSSVIPGVTKTDLSSVERSVILDKAREILEPKRDHLLSQFGRIGLIARQLVTQEIIQLFYLSYNPEAAEGQQITDTNSYTTPLVRASVSRGGNMNDATVTPGVAPVATPPETTSAPVAVPNPVPVQAMPDTTITTPDLTAPASAPVFNPNLAPDPSEAPQSEINSGVQASPTISTPEPIVVTPVPTPASTESVVTTPMPNPVAETTPVETPNPAV